MGIHLDPSAHLICYLLGSSQLGMAFLSFFSRRLDDVDTARLVSRTFIVVHVSTALVEAYAFMRGGVAAAIWGNVALRVIVVALFAHYGPRSRSARSASVSLRE